MEERFPLTPSQTVGPFFHGALVRDGESVSAGAAGDEGRIAIVGRVLDGDGAPVDDAMVEIWEPLRVADGGRPGLRSFVRSDTVGEGRFAVEVRKPEAPSPGGGERAAPSIDVRVFARGLLRHLVTRIYFPDEANDADPVLQAVHPSRRETLVAAREESASGPPTYRFDIRLQGPGETVFFELGEGSP